MTKTKIEDWMKDEYNKRLMEIIAGKKAEGKTDEDIEHYLFSQGTYCLRMCGYNQRGEDLGLGNGEFVRPEGYK